VEEDEEGDSV